MYEYLKSLEKDSIEFITESAFEQFNLDKLNIDNEYNMAIRLLNISENADDTEDLSEVKRHKFGSKISSTFKSLCGATGKVLDNMSRKLTGEKSSNINDYLSSRAGEIRMDQDIRKIQEEVKKALRESDELVQAIAKGLHVSDEKVEAYIARTKEIFDNNPDAAITAAAAAGVYAAQITIYDDMRKQAGKDGVYQQCKTMEGQKQIQQIINATSNMLHKESRIFSIFMSKYDSLDRKSNK